MGIDWTMDGEIEHLKDGMVGNYFYLLAMTVAVGSMTYTQKVAIGLIVNLLFTKLPTLTSTTQTKLTTKN